MKKLCVMFMLMLLPISAVFAQNQLDIVNNTNIDFQLISRAISLTSSCPNPVITSFTNRIQVTNNSPLFTTSYATGPSDVIYEVNFGQWTFTPFYDGTVGDCYSYTCIGSPCPYSSSVLYNAGGTTVVVTYTLATPTSNARIEFN